MLFCSFIFFGPKKGRVVCDLNEQVKVENFQFSCEINPMVHLFGFLLLHLEK